MCLLYYPIYVYFQFILFILTFDYAASKFKVTNNLDPGQYFQLSDITSAINKNPQKFNTKHTECEPGDIIKFECNQCVCTSTGVMKCTKSKCPNRKTVEERKRELAANCKTGEMLKLDCNRCLCIRRGKVECAEKKCVKVKTEKTPIFSVAEQNKRINKIGKTCNVGDVIASNCKTCTCRSPGNLKCTNPKKNCKTIPGLTIKLKEEEDKDQTRLVSSQCSPKDKITVACNKCICEPGTSMICTLIWCGGSNDFHPSEDKDDDQSEDQDKNDDSDPGSKENEDPGPDKDQAPENEPDPDSNENRPDKPKENTNKDTPKDGGISGQKNNDILKSIMEIKKAGKNCKPKQIIETICHVCECVLAGIVNCELKKGYDEFAKLSSTTGRKPKQTGFGKIWIRRATKENTLLEDDAMRSPVSIPLLSRVI